MGSRTSYPPGTFSWVDLATTDVDGARDFYTVLFGWVGDAEAGGSMLRLDGALVAAIFPLSDDSRAAGTPASWTSYVAVDDVDASAARAVELGGGVAREPFDIMDVGRVALVEDPQGALVALWQAGTHFGAERVNDVGCLCMNELVTSDLDTARAFYEMLFGWTTGLVDTGLGAQRRIVERTHERRARPTPLAALLQRRVDRGDHRPARRARWGGARRSLPHPRRQHRRGARPAGCRVRALRGRDRSLIDQSEGGPSASIAYATSSS
jgi:predicted enzyme related to lactoylglutathione lyase